MHILDDLRKRHPDVLFTCGQVSIPRASLWTRRAPSALCTRLLGRHSEALGRPIFVVPLARVTAREVIPAMLAKVDRERVHLHAVAVPL
jgi:hypothetical protein